MNFKATSEFRVSISIIYAADWLRESSLCNRPIEWITLVYFGMEL